MNGMDALLTIGFAVLGGFIGWTYCRLVRYSVERLDGGPNRMSPFVALMLVRIALVVGGLILAAQFGGWALVGNIVGFFVVRTVMVGRSHIKEIAAAESKKMKDTSGEG